MEALPPRRSAGARRAGPGRARVLALAGAVALLTGCAPEAPPPPAAAEEADPAADAPAGAVLLVEGQAVFPDDVADMQAAIAELYPEYTPIHVLRLALTNDTLPRLALRAAHSEQWSHALEACTSVDIEHVQRTSGVHRAEGNFRALGVNLWIAARELPLGQWSEPVELIGRFVRVRLDRRITANDPRIERLHISLIEFPVVSPERLDDALDAAIDGARLTLLDPLFAEAVPETWKHRMHARNP